MTEFGAVDVNALRDGREKTFHGTDCSEDTFRRDHEGLTVATLRAVIRRTSEPSERTT